MTRLGFLLIAAAVSAAPVVASHGETWETLTRVPLNNPRGIDIAPNGDLYVAEAGGGGTAPCFANPEGGERCYGKSGAISRIDSRTGWVERIVKHLPSLAAGGASATGAHDVSLDQRGRIIFTLGLGADPATRAGVLADFAYVYSVQKNRATKLFDAGAIEATDPDQDGPDTNPYGVLDLPGKTVFVDAGGNSLIERRDNGTVKVLATFPDRLVPAPFPPFDPLPMDAVPTQVAQGPDGAYYVSQLTGFPFPQGGAVVFRVPENGGSALPFADGFSAIIDLAFGPDGSLYVLEIAKNGLLNAFQTGDFAGRVTRVLPNGDKREIDSNGLVAPGGIVVARTNTIYVTNYSVQPNQGQVVRLRQPKNGRK